MGASLNQPQQIPMTAKVVKVARQCKGRIVAVGQFRLMIVPADAVIQRKRTLFVRKRHKGFVDGGEETELKTIGER